ncbi:hypothetical protein HUX53_00345 [Actinomadura sp. BRA 177]|nr:hypothetical protein [Actinomadura sp. BRA 177]
MGEHAECIGEIERLLSTDRTQQLDNDRAGRHLVVQSTPPLELHTDPDHIVDQQIAERRGITLFDRENPLDLDRLRTHRQLIDRSGQPCVESLRGNPAQGPIDGTDIHDRPPTPIRR